MKFTVKIILQTFLLSFFLSCKKDDSSAILTRSTSETSKTTLSGTVTLPLVSSIATSTSTTYKSVSLIANTAYYIDRTYKITAFPAALSGSQLIQTAEADKFSTSSKLFSFTLNQAATIYVGYDPRAKVLPSWLQGWTRSGMSITINDPELSTLTVYSRSFAAGTVTFGANMASPAVGALTQFVVLAKAQATPTVNAPPTSFTLGINGHSLGQPSYKALTATEQISMLKKMGMTSYRQDIDFNNDGTISNLPLFTSLYNAAKAGGVNILPMVYTRTLNYSSSSSASYSAGKSLGISVATKNQQYFTYYELGNELDNQVILSGNGDKTSEYNIQKFNIVAAYLKGMNDGIKSVQPGAKTMVDASWLHYAYLQMLLSYGVNFDIIAYHWYSEMEGIAANKSLNIPDITKKLSSLFTQPIWFTEVGERYKNESNIDQLQSAFFQEFKTKCENNSQVKALIFYELMDEPEKNSLLESNYGITKWNTPYSSWSDKQAATSLIINN